MERILDEIRKERERQDDKYGGPDHDDIHYPGDWCLILTKYLGRAAAETIGGSDETAFRDAMIKLAAVAVAATESFDRIQGDAKEPA
ncbi:MAG: hypothetical protein ACR2QH_03940 [Geminicoccaceae bacterium]